ncbi:unnamed protein product, partial [marine sediment metagenome]
QPPAEWVAFLELLSLLRSRKRGETGGVPPASLRSDLAQWGLGMDDTGPIEIEYVGAKQVNERQGSDRRTGKIYDEYFSVRNATLTTRGPGK